MIGVGDVEATTKAGDSEREYEERADQCTRSEGEEYDLCDEDGDGEENSEDAADKINEEEMEEESQHPDVSKDYHDDDDEYFVDDDLLYPPRNGFFERQAKRVARHPRIHFMVALVISLGLGAIGLIAGDFSVAVNNSGWQSRGTEIADRETQSILVRRNRWDLFDGTVEVWDDLINTVRPGWEDDDDATDDDVSSRRLGGEENSFSVSSLYKMMLPKEGPLSASISEDRKHLPFHVTEDQRRRLQDESESGSLAGCDISWYESSTMTQDTHLWPVWKTQDPSRTALDSELIRDLCEAEGVTQSKLEDENLCIACEGGGCLPPFSLVMYARLAVPDGFSLDCEALGDEWSAYQQGTEEAWDPCVEDIKKDFDPDDGSFELPGSCPFGFYPTLSDERYDSTHRVEYTSSIFATIEASQKLFENVGSYSRGTNLIKGAYDTQYEDFVDIQVDDSLTNDMILAFGSAAVTALAMLVHTRSPFLTLIGLLQIILSFPLAFFVYKFIAGLDFFPVLNFIGVFVVFALGADDVFVAVDKWKNARIEHGDASTEYVAAAALPDAAGAMFLTTLTTAVAFFGTAICPVAPVICFAVFCGLLIVFDYVMCVALVFPALCMYDNTREHSNGCMRCHCCKRCEAKGVRGEEDDEKPSLIRRILLSFYDVMHRFRWLWFLVCCGGLAVSAYYATRLGLPTSSDVRLIKSSDFQYELNFEWRQNLLFDMLVKKDGSQAFVQWGTKAADTGNHNDPESFSQLVLDDEFTPSSEDVQIYLQGFCDKFFAQEFAELVDFDYVCPINMFDRWLRQESQSDDPSGAYVSNCGGASGLPVPQDIFDRCIVAWSKEVGEASILAREGVVEIMYIKFNSRVRYDSPFQDLDDEWHMIECWMSNERDNVAPVGVRGFYHTSEDFWWYDTNGQMLRTAYASAGIALAAAAAVILLSSRSVVLTIFSVFTISFILCSVTALLVGFGWTLGFLESVCFAILIGISCDFVIHFTHAYAALPGMASRGERTRHALITMGPSILAAAFTTIAAAIVMLFTVITFFEKFALILFLTILMATIGSFFVFITLADCIGPTQPTYLMDKLFAKCRACRCKRKESDAPKATGVEPADHQEIFEESEEIEVPEESVAKSAEYPSESVNRP